MIDRIVIGESGGPTPVIDWEVAGALDAAQQAGIEVYGAVNGLSGLLNADVDGNLVDLTDVDPMSFCYNGPGAGLGTTRIKPDDDQYRKIAEHMDAFGIDGIVYIGGNDTAAQLAGLAEHTETKTIHAIKTVDNDLPATHHCPGWGSAALYNATALKNVHSDYSSYRARSSYRTDDGVRQTFDVAPLAIYQVMGRTSGWLAEATAFARVDPRGMMVEDRPPHLILPKEVPFSTETFLDELDDVISRLGEAVVVVQEDLTDATTGKNLAELHADEVPLDQHGNIQHGRATSFSTSVFLAQVVKNQLNVDAVHGKIKDVALVPQHIQRSCMMSEVDASEAYRVGYASVEAMLDGATERSVVLRQVKGYARTDLTALTNIAGKERQVPDEYLRGLYGPTQAFVNEYLYLVGGPVGIPHHSSGRFESVPVPDAVRHAPSVGARTD